MAEQFVNFAETTLDGALNDSSTSVPVVNGGVFPATGDFRLVCENEIMKATSRSGNTLTVQRGAESTTAVSHASGTPIKLVLTAESLPTIISENGTPALRLYMYDSFK